MYCIDPICKDYPNDAQLGFLYLYDITLCLGFIYSLAVIIDANKAEMLNASILCPISAFSAFERLSVLLFGNGMLKNHRFENDTVTEVCLLFIIGISFTQLCTTLSKFVLKVSVKLMIALSCFVDAKSTKSRTNRQRQYLLAFEAIYLCLVFYYQLKTKSWPYGYLESAGPVHYLFGRFLTLNRLRSTICSSTLASDDMFDKNR